MGCPYFIIRCEYSQMDHEAPALHYLARASVLMSRGLTRRAQVGIASQVPKLGDNGILVGELRPMALEPW